MNIKTPSTCSKIILITLMSQCISSVGIAFDIESYTQASVDVQEHEGDLGTAWSKAAEITTDEYTQYKHVMDNPYYAKHFEGLSVPFVLGMMSDSDAERMRYAKMEVQLDHDRVERILAFQHAYSDAHEMLYGHIKPVATDMNDVSDIEVSSQDTFVAFLKMNARSAHVLKKLISSSKNAAFVSIHTYFVGDPSSFELNEWASSNGLDALREAGSTIKITYNLDDAGTQEKITHAFGEGAHIAYPSVLKITDTDARVMIGGER